MYDSEILMYPDIITWLESDLIQKYQRQVETIKVLDTHDSDLRNYIIKLNYQKYFPAHTTYQIRQDITAFIQYNDRIDLVFVECKNKRLSLMNLSQIIGYSCMALPIYSILLSPLGMGTTLSKLLLTYDRKDILEFRPNRKIRIIKWDSSRKDIDYSKSVI